MIIHKSNLLLLVPVDNCKNEGFPVILSIHADNTAPEVSSEAASSNLTNGTTELIRTPDSYGIHIRTGLVNDREALIKAVIGRTLYDYKDGRFNRFLIGEMGVGAIDMINREEHRKEIKKGAWLPDFESEYLNNPKEILKTIFGIDSPEIS